ncbi:hypothetical protein M9458_041741, partial [Cirrhinus mrigala]
PGHPYGRSDRNHERQTARPSLIGSRITPHPHSSDASNSQDSFEEAHLVREKWKQVQGLAEMFWNEWKHEYLKTLQLRHKWQGKRPNLQEGDIVLLKDNQAKRNQWPMGLISKTLPGEDGLVRKVQVEIVKDGTRKAFSRPVTEV